MLYIIKINSKDVFIFLCWYLSKNDIKSVVFLFNNINSMTRKTRFFCSINIYKITHFLYIARARAVKTNIGIEWIPDQLRTGKTW